MATDRAGRTRARLAAALVALGLVAPGCERDELPNMARQPVEIAALPENVREAARKALPGVTLGDAWKNIDRSTKSLHSYEVRGRAANGKVREVRVSTKGEILETE